MAIVKISITIRGDVYEMYFLLLLLVIYLPIFNYKKSRQSIFCSQQTHKLQKIKLL